MNPRTHLIVGIDYSKHKANLALLRGDNRFLGHTYHFSNSLSGFEKAKQVILEVIQDNQIETLAISGEATSYYWLPSFAQIAQDPELAAYQCKLYLLNARWVKHYKQIKPSNHKDDDLDAEEIARYVLSQNPPTEWHFDPRWLPLRLLTRLRFHLVRSLTREKNLLDLYLFLVHSSFTQRKPFSRPLNKVSQQLLLRPDLLQEISQLSEQEAADLLSDFSAYLKQPEQNAHRLQAVLQDDFPLNEDLGGILQWGLDLLVETCNLLADQIHKIDKKIEQLVQDKYPEIGWLDSIPGIGLTIAAGLAAEIGNLERFTQPEIWDRRQLCHRRRRSKEVTDAICKYAGLWWPKNQSGQFTAEERRMSREGNAYLRYYALLAGDCMRRSIPSMAAYYQKKYSEANKHKHKRALVLTGHKALDLVVTLLRRKESYKAEEGIASIC
jgi:transposase